MHSHISAREEENKKSKFDMVAVADHHKVFHYLVNLITICCKYMSFTGSIVVVAVTILNIPLLASSLAPRT